MKQLILSLLLLILCISPIVAQITIGNEHFPEVGDTLFTATDNLPSINITAAGPDQVWDFSSLQAPFTTSTILKSSIEGAVFDTFPAATIISDFGNGGEAYYKKSNEQYNFLGYHGGEDPTGLGLNLTVLFKPATIERRAPLSYLDAHSSSSNANIPFSADLLPSEILGNLPITPDSIRIRINTSREEEVDAWGILTIPGDTYDVLRQKRIETQNVRLEVKVSFFPWQDITDLLGDTGGLGERTTLSYHFWSNEAKEPIAVVTLDQEQNAVQSVQYKAIDISSSTIRPIGGKADIIAYPNPAIDSARFEFSNLNTGRYKLKIYNILGVVIWEEEYSVQRSKTVEVSLANLRKGTYLYSLQTEEGKAIATKRLLIIRP